MSRIGFLDSETNLKAKQALSVTGQLGGDVDALAAFSGETLPASVSSLADQHWLTEEDIAIFLAVLAPWNNNVSEYENMSGNTRICIKICIQELNMYSKIEFSRIAIRTLMSRSENMQFLKSTNSCTLPFH